MAPHARRPSQLRHLRVPSAPGRGCHGRPGGLGLGVSGSVSPLPPPGAAAVPRPGVRRVLMHSKPLRQALWQHGFGFDPVPSVINKC